MDGYIAPVHRCLRKSRVVLKNHFQNSLHFAAKKPTDICRHYAEKYALEHQTNQSYFIFDDHCLDLKETSPEAPLATVRFNCSDSSYSVPTNASSNELQDGFVHVKNYCVSK